MYARSTTIQASPSSIDDGIAYIRDEVMPVMRDMDGCVGMSLLVDRESGRCIATSSWQTQQAMRASSNAVQPMRETGASRFGGTIEGMQEWEIAVLHREHETREGTCVRVTWLKGDPSQADRGLEVFRDSVLPQAEELDGFCSASLLIDRKTGRMAAATAWDDRRAMEASRTAASGIRTATASELSAQIEEVREFELAIAHLRVPELA